ncbi:MAG: carbamoyltransferase HypF [Candidatus Thiodiazotropha sp.]
MTDRVVAERIRVRGLVQGVGFRPTVWRLAQACGLRGEVWNDSEGVEMLVCGEPAGIERLCALLIEERPPLARIDAIERTPVDALPQSEAFHIRKSRSGEIRTGVVPDAAICAACRREIDDPADRRYRYPFTNCTHCGPRLSIVERIPYDRGNTSMRHFAMCPACSAEYADPADRRFHAQPNACPVCGPRVWLTDAEGQPMAPAADGGDAVEQASRLLARGEILAIKGIGGFHLACDATDAAAVARLRQRKGRYRKPFALMARDLAVIERYCRVSGPEAALLQSPAAPIVLLQRAEKEPLPDAVAPAQASLGFMLPYTPLHHLLLAAWEHPLIMTSGNRIEEPQCMDNAEAARRLQSLADGFLLHDREIVNRVDDSVARLMDGQARLLRRARGYAPAPIPLPEGFAETPPLLALGGELKNTFCLLRRGEAILSQHLGDLENLISYQDYLANLSLYGALYQHRPAFLAADLHPNYRSTQHAQALAAEQDLPLIQVQHHHAHIASVLAENGWPLQGGRVLGIALDGSGYGGDGTIWGGEFLLADYLGFTRLGAFRPTPLPGGTQAILQPWRNSFSHLQTSLGWERVMADWVALEPVQWLDRQPLKTLTRMIDGGINSPLSSSCGRLFDGVAALLGICRESISYEGQAAIELETAALAAGPRDPEGYPLRIDEGDGLWQLDPAPLWPALLDDLRAGMAVSRIAWRFHLGLASAVAGMAVRLARVSAVSTVALSGGVFQNRTLFELVVSQLREAGLRVLSHSRVPANDGGISLGQAAVGAARMLNHTDR